MTTFIPHVIDGEEVESSSGARFDSVDPWTRQTYAEVALGGAEDADRAVATARRAFDDGPWPATTSWRCAPTLPKTSPYALRWPRSPTVWAASTS